MAGEKLEIRLDYNSIIAETIREDEFSFTVPQFSGGDVCPDALVLRFYSL